MIYQTKQPVSLPRKLEILESLRGIAALLILTYHTTSLFRLKFNQSFLFSFFSFGDSGVDFFFTLSGFFLALSSLKLIGKREEAKNFLLKRVFRIYPLYWTINLFIIPIYFLIPSFGRGHERNIAVIIKSILLFPQDKLPILSVAWFLSHIIFFYLIFSTLIFFKSKIPGRIIALWIALSICFLLADIVTEPSLRDNTNYLLVFIFSYYNLEFIFGFAIGLLIQNFRMKERTSLTILLIGCLTFLCFGFLKTNLFQSEINIPQYYDFFAYGLSSTLIVGGAAFLEIRKKIAVNKSFLILGAAAFSIYLTHYPVLSISTKVIQATNIENYIFQTFGMILSCIFAVFTGIWIHLFIEKKLASVIKNKMILDKA